MIRYLRMGPRQASKLMAVLATIALLLGGMLMVWSSYIHFHLWVDLSYRHISTIGSLFLMQSIVGLLLGLAVMAVRQVWVAILCAGFAVATMVGFLISVEYGLFGFKDAWAAPFADQAFAIEIATILVLTAACLLCVIGSAAPSRTGSTSPSRRNPFQ